MIHLFLVLPICPSFLTKTPHPKWCKHFLMYAVCQLTVIANITLTMLFQQQKLRVPGKLICSLPSLSLVRVICSSFGSVSSPCLTPAISFFTYTTVAQHAARRQNVVHDTVIWPAETFETRKRPLTLYFKKPTQNAKTILRLMKCLLTETYITLH